MRAFLSDLRKRLSRQEPKQEVRFDDIGFMVFERRKKPVRATWAKVREVFAYKDDRFTYDDICIGFRFDDAGSYRWVAEDYIGYKDLLEELKRRFPGIRTDWFAKVALPAFSQNRTTLWSQPWLPPHK